MGRNTKKYMKNLIITKAKEDIPLYFDDFKKFWDSAYGEISDDDLYEIYRATLIFKNYKIVFHSLSLDSFDLILDEIFEDINSSFFLSLIGLYRSAHMHLRSSIEITLQLIYFIHHPIEYKRWKDGNFVIKHDKITQYVATHPNFDTDISSLMTTITQYWKKFSKHIHGESPIFFQSETDVRKTNTFSIKDYNIWKGNFTKNIYVLNKLLLLFFKNDISRFPHKSFEMLTSILKEEDRKLIENNN